DPQAARLAPSATSFRSKAGWPCADDEDLPGARRGRKRLRVSAELRVDGAPHRCAQRDVADAGVLVDARPDAVAFTVGELARHVRDRKSTRLNSSHVKIS